MRKFRKLKGPMRKENKETGYKTPYLWTEDYLWLLGTVRLQKVVIPCLLLEFSFAIFSEQLGSLVMGRGSMRGGRVRAEQYMETYRGKGFHLMGFSEFWVFAFLTSLLPQGGL